MHCEEAINTHKAREIACEHAGTQARRHAGTQARRHAGTQARRHAPYISHALEMSRTQKLKQHDDDSGHSDDDSKFDAFAKELEST